MSKELVTKENENLPAVISFDEFEGEGYGHLSKDDYLISRIVVVQALSNQKKKSDKNYIIDANDGDIVDATRKRILAKEGETITFLPVERKKEIFEWDSKVKGVIVNRFELKSEFDDWLKEHGAKTVRTKQGNGKDKISYVLPNGNEIVYFVNVYGILVTDAGAEFAFVSFKGSALRVEKEWLNNIRDLRFVKNGKSITAPIFYSTWTIGSRDVKNSSGEEWKAFEITKGAYLHSPTADGKTLATSNLPPAIASELFEAQKSIRELLNSGEFATDLADEVVTSDDVPF